MFTINDMVKNFEDISMFCRLNANIKKATKIRSSEMGALLYIKDQGNSVKPIELSKYLNISKPSVSDIVKSLASNKYIKKVVDDNDKRSYSIALTTNGIKLIDETIGEHLSTISVLQNKMGHKDYIEFITLLSKANSILKG